MGKYSSFSFSNAVNALSKWNCHRRPSDCIGYDTPTPPLPPPSKEIIPQAGRKVIDSKYLHSLARWWQDGRSSSRPDHWAGVCAQVGWSRLWARKHWSSAPFFLQRTIRQGVRSLKDVRVVWLTNCGSQCFFSAPIRHGTCLGLVLDLTQLVWPWLKSLGNFFGQKISEISLRY